MAFLWLKESQQKEQKTGVSSRILCDDCTEEDKEERGCHGGVEWIVGGVKIDGCPENYINEETMNSINIWQDWKLFGDYEFPGNRSEQPHYMIESIRILETLSRSK